MPVWVAVAVSVGELVGLLTPASPLECFRQTEVQHLHAAVRPHLDVGGLEIAMDDALFVRGFKGVGDLLRDRQGVVERDVRARCARQIVAFDQLHDRARTAPHSSRPWMCAMFGWLRDASTCASRWNRASRSGSAPNKIGQDLDRDVAMELRVAGAVDLAHATFADLRGDFVDAETGASRQGHEVRAILMPPSRVTKGNLITTSRDLNIHLRGLHAAMEKLEAHRPAVAQPLHSAEENPPADVPPSGEQPASKSSTIQ